MIFSLELYIISFVGNPDGNTEYRSVVTPPFSKSHDILEYCAPVTETTVKTTATNINSVNLTLQTLYDNSLS